MRRLVLVTSIAGVLLAGSAAAQTRDENWGRCRGDNPDLRIGACTALIQSGRESTADVALAFHNRGIGYYDITQPIIRAMRRWLLIGAAVLAGVVAANAQRRFREPYYRSDLTYDGRFTFVRLRWESGRGFGRWGGNSNAWNHDYPRAEQHLARLLKDITYIDARTDGSLILTLDDPELFKYPIAYMWEPGFWVLSDEEALRFREYLLKGGFAIFDDFEHEQWNNYEQQMRRVLPEGRFFKLDASHQVFDTFFRMKTIDFPHPMYGILPTYYGIFEDNDPSKRLMVIANHNHDVAEYWEFSGEGLFPVDTSNEAYKLGVNYMIYGMMH